MSLVTIERTKKYLVVKIPFGAMKEGKAVISPRSQRIIDRAIRRGLRDIEAGRSFGPFGSVGEFKRTLHVSPGK